MLNSPFKSPRVGPSAAVLTLNQNQHPRNSKVMFFYTHRRRADFTDACLLGDRTYLVDEGIRISKFFPARLEDRALWRGLELVQSWLVHRFRPTQRWLGRDRSLLPSCHGLPGVFLSPQKIKIKTCRQTQRQSTNINTEETAPHSHYCTHPRTERERERDCSKALSTSARKNRHQALLTSARAICQVSKQ